MCKVVVGGAVVMVLGMLNMLSLQLQKFRKMQKCSFVEFKAK